MFTNDIARHLRDSNPVRGRKENLGTVGAVVLVAGGLILVPMVIAGVMAVTTAKKISNSIPQY